MSNGSTLVLLAEAGNSMKSVNGWNIKRKRGPTSGFEAMAGGFRAVVGAFLQDGEWAGWWSLQNIHLLTWITITK